MILHGYLICFIFLQVILVIGAPTHNHSTDLVKRQQYVIVDCDVPGSTSFLLHAHEDVLLAANKGVEQLLYLKSFLELCLETGRGRSSANKRQLMILMTFESIYGKVLYEPAEEDGQRARTQFGKWKVTGILNRAIRIMRIPFNSAPSFYRVFCYETFIIPLWIYEFGLSSKFTLWDSRPKQEGGGTLINGDPRGSELYTYFNKETRQDTMIIHPDKLTTLMGSRPFSQLRTIDNWDPHTALQDIMTRSMAGIWLHEISHSPYVLGDDGILRFGMRVWSRGYAFGWPCITHLAQTAEIRALKNADSFSYFIAAMYLKPPIGILAMQDDILGAQAETINSILPYAWVANLGY